MAVTSTLPQSIPTTPDIENAELTPILPFLFLGNEHDAQDLEKMQRLNIGYIINVTTHLPLYHYEKGLFNYKRLPATDSNKQNLRQYFEEAFEFIGNMAQEHGKAESPEEGFFSEEDTNLGLLQAQQLEHNLLAKRRPCAAQGNVAR
uniref:Dual specificity protein phosphatase 10 n=1 Tax=Sphaerodactylus townsendi TaxID=933632 RepID=A0ACB8G9V2_9SAUR